MPPPKPTSDARLTPPESRSGRRGLLAGALVLLARAVTAANLTLLGEIPIAPGANGLNDGLFVHDNLVFLMVQGCAGGGCAPPGDSVHIYDVDDPASPRLLATAALPASPGDMHAIAYANGFLYAGVEGSAGGVVVFDVRDPATPALVAHYTAHGSVHNLRLGGNHLYLAPTSFSNTDIVVLDVTDPANPVRVGEFDLRPGDSYCHDVSVMDGVAYASMWDDGLFLLDVADPAAPTTITSHPAASNNTHSAWPSADRRHVITGHESTNEPMKVFQLDGANLRQVAEWSSHELMSNTIFHDLMVVGDIAWISYYEEGARVVDLSDPQRPVEIASFVTEPGCGGGSVAFCGAISQWLEEDRFYILSMSTGLSIFRLDRPHAAPLQILAVKSPDGADALLQWNHNGESQYTVRRRDRKEALSGALLHDVDGELQHADRGAVPGSELFFYTLNGDWR